MSVHVIEWGRQEEIESFITNIDAKTYESAVQMWCDAQAGPVDIETAQPEVQTISPLHALTCENCGAPLKGYTCEYCGTNYVAELVVQEEIEEQKAKLYKLEMKAKTAELEAAMQEQIARLYELMGINAELKDIAKEMKIL